ncbi:MAG: M1 family aminopeptidase, partial [Methylocystaceae bacterium]
GYQVVAGAELVNRMSDDRGMETWVFSSTRARDFACAAFLPGYQMESRQVGKTDVQIWGKSRSLAATADNAASILEYYQQIFTAYPRTQLKLVEVPMQGFMGMEYDGLIFISNRAMADSYPPVQRSHLVAHEIAHQWWYALVGNDQATEPWLDEGLASWSAQLYAREQGESNGVLNSSSRQLSWPLTAFKTNEQYMDAVYSGGETFWLQVEKKVGRAKLLRGLNEYLKTSSGQVASTGDMFSALMQGGVDSEVLYACWQRR